MDNIVITGYGIKAPGALSKESFKRILEEGICTQSVLEGRGPNESSVIAGLIEDDFLHIKERNYKRYPRSTRLALAAANDAVEMANLSCDPYKVAVIMGTSAGAILEIEQYSTVALNLKKYPVQGVSLVDTHTLSATVAEHIGLRGPAFTITTGCTASLDTILLAKLLLESGQVEACIVGGTDSPLGQWSINGFSKTRSITSNVSIEQTGVPFSNEHHGFVLSEGAGVLVLEREENALKRGKSVYGRIQNVLSKNEGRPILKSDETGQEMLSLYKDTLGEALPCYVNSQALGLHTNDRIEGFIHKELFQHSIPITSIKGMMGHSFAAMGAIQIISSLISMEYGFIPPTIKTSGRGFEELPIVYKTIYQPVQAVSVTNHGNSGNNACILLTK
ncbi:beta-ketoacyl synthase N-terminal-like domain-containing protein [Rossellomorea aquimaris]|uniref:beta-ketoacyl synthase N-terminal-like domain-containing protein n=1 Tax=Rossellomorea aquimaris TaxID=189382 RepID=UPI000B143D5A|nr:beta-ketoacyl synthase N-terminal-like domain-containing protein [Rossellomorea aquimaris]